MKIYYSASHKDESLRKELESHLGVLKRRGLVTDWHRQYIVPGQDRKAQIMTQLGSADIFLLLISPDYVVCEECAVEAEYAMQRHSREEARIIPILLRHISDWESLSYGALEPLPANRKPVKEWKNRDKAFISIIEGINIVIEKIRINRISKLLEKLNEKQGRKTTGPDTKTKIWTLRHYLGPFVAGRCLLWVDDAPENNLIEQRIFREFGVQIELAINTKQALMAIKSGTRFDLIISDWNRFPQEEEISEGMRLLNEIRILGNEVPIIFYTGVQSFSRHRELVAGKHVTGFTWDPEELLRWAAAELLRSAALDSASEFARLPLFLQMGTIDL